MSNTTRALTAFALVATFVTAATGGCELISVIDRSALDANGGAGGDAMSSSSTGTCACAAVTDCPDPGTACVVAKCDGCACSTVNAAAGTPCTDGGGAVCDGAGTCVACNDATDCPATNLDCVEATCESGVCGTMNVGMGMPATTQTAGDCLTIVCDGNGSTTTSPDDNDVPNDGTVCTTDTCSGGAGVHTPAAGACSEGGGKVCGDPAGAGKGTCVACNVDGDCTGPMVCQVNLCVPTTCMNGGKDNNETDVDCGGIDCAPCGNNLSCLVGTDCQSGVCGGNGKCAAPSCSDGIENQDETDVDCGGSCAGVPSNKACGDTLKCLQPSDCQSGVCGGNPLSCQVPSCSDAVKNGSESDVDCGATCGMAKLCANALSCGGAADCQSGVCNGGTCAPCLADANCLANQYCDGAVNGGTCVADQANGGACTSDLQCVSGFCTDGFCCNTACATTCNACNVPGTLGTCSPIAAGQPDNNPANACDSGGTKKCDGAGVCKGSVVIGAACNADSDCASGFCTDGVCCNSACATTCNSCNVAGSVGACTPIPAGQPDNNPVGACTGTCNGSGACQKANGQPCAVAGDCSSNFCADGVCCNSACGADCFACNLAPSNGTCTALPHGTTDGACVAPNACGAAGACLKAIGQSCSVAGDCASGLCAGGGTCKCTADSDCPAATPNCAPGPNTCGP